MPLLTAAQLSAVQSVAIQGMVTPVTIKRRTSASNAYGEDVSYSTVTTANGWFFSSPTALQGEDAGSLVTDNTYRLYLPVGTNILSGDEITVGSGIYIVTDTTSESTWPALLNVSLRKRE